MSHGDEALVSTLYKEFLKVFPRFQEQNFKDNAFGKLLKKELDALARADTAWVSVTRVNGSMDGQSGSKYTNIVLRNP